MRPAAPPRVQRLSCAAWRARRRGRRARAAACDRGAPAACGASCGRRFRARLGSGRRLGAETARRAAVAAARRGAARRAGGRTRDAGGGGGGGGGAAGDWRGARGAARPTPLPLASPPPPARRPTVPCIFHTPFSIFQSPFFSSFICLAIAAAAAEAGAAGCAAARVRRGGARALSPAAQRVPRARRARVSGGGAAGREVWRW